jgi:hypothetical protein
MPDPHLPRTLVTTPAAPDDTGEPDPELAAALGALHGTAAGDARLHTALLHARLLVPVVAVLLATDEVTGADKATEMAVPALIGNDGRRALPAFTSYAALRRWRDDARPVPMDGARVIAGAVAEAYDAVVLDLAGPVVHVVEGDVLAALAAAAEQMLETGASALVVE